jgi:hypothetical protein
MRHGRFRGTRQIAKKAEAEPKGTAFRLDQAPRNSSLGGMLFRHDLNVKLAARIGRRTML